MKEVIAIPFIALGFLSKRVIIWAYGDWTSERECIKCGHKGSPFIKNILMNESLIRNHQYPRGERSVCRGECDCVKCTQRIDEMMKDGEIYNLGHFINE